MMYVPGRFHKGPDAMARVPREGQYDEGPGEVSSILDGTSKKSLRVGIFQNFWSPQTEEGECNISDHQAKAVMEDKFRNLGVKVQEDRVAGCDISAMGEKIMQALSWEMLEAETSADPELSAIREDI